MVTFYEYRKGFINEKMYFFTFIDLKKMNSEFLKEVYYNLQL